MNNLRGVKYFDTNLKKLKICLQPSDKPKLVQYARKIDLKSNRFGWLLSSKV